MVKNVKQTNYQYVHQYYISTCALQVNHNSPIATPATLAKLAAIATLATLASFGTLTTLATFATLPTLSILATPVTFAIRLLR